MSSEGDSGPEERNANEWLGRATERKRGWWEQPGQKWVRMAVEHPARMWGQQRGGVQGLTGLCARDGSASASAALG